MAIGKLQSVDGYMNIALEETEEFAGKKLTNNYEDVFIRGNNGRSLHLLPNFNIQQGRVLMLFESSVVYICSIDMYWFI